jgi:hypothetical protein
MCYNEIETLSLPLYDAVIGAISSRPGYDNINLDLELGIVIPVDGPPDENDLWLRVKQHPGVVIYIENVSLMEELK